MRTMNRRSMGMAIGVLLVGLTACGGRVNQLGAQEVAPISLSAISAFGSDEAAPWTTEVRSASKGLVTVDAGPRAVRDTDVDLRILDDLKAGAADIGLVGTRAWTAQGVHAFDALMAPFLVDSYELQGKVLGSGILAGADQALEDQGYRLLGVLPGPLRFAVGKDRAFDAPSDFAGARVGLTDSDIGRSTLAALGAEPIAVAPGTTLASLDGIEIHAGAVGEVGATEFTGNAVLWPRPISVVMTAERFGQLTPEQQTVLMKALQASRAGVLDGQVSFEREGLASACRDGVRVGTASVSGLEALRSAVEPVYAELREDAATATAIDAIIALRTGPGAALSCEVDAGAPATPSTAVSAIDGSWTACPTAADIVAKGGGPQEAEGNDGCATLTFDRGVYRERGAQAVDAEAGSFWIDGNQLTILRHNNELFTFTFSLYQDQLILSTPVDPRGVSPAPMRALPWARGSN